MIFYNHDKEILTEFIKYKPRSCFIMTQLRKPIPKKILKIRNEVSACLSEANINEIDAESLITGRDFLSKIWNQLLSVPMGIAIISEELTLSTVSNIFYEVGVLNALGKDSIIIKTSSYKIPSDFVRTEYVDYGRGFKRKVKSFLNSTLELADHFDTMAESLEVHPLLSIDYWRRAYLISGNELYIDKAESLFKKEKFDTQTRFFIHNFIKSKGKTLHNKGS